MTAELRQGSLSDFLESWARQAPDHVALVDSSREISYGQLDLAATRIANALADAGLGARVGILGKNSAALYEVWFGANRAGCALVPFNWRSAPRELAALVDDAEPAVLVVGDEFASLAREALLQSTAQPRVIVESALDAWLSGVSDSRPQLQLRSSDVALLAYTSGTTARPKGVPITNDALIRWFHAAATDPATAWLHSDVGLMVMPNFHLAGTWVSLPALMHGATLVVLPAFEPERFLQAVQSYRVTRTCLVPTAIHAVLQALSTCSSDLTSLRSIMYAGSPIAVETLRSVIGSFDCDLVQFYGTTETFIISLLRPEQHHLTDAQILRSCGRPMPQVRVRLIDTAGGDVPDGSPGELLVESPWMFAGYWRNSEATDAALSGGWYHTGDVGFRDQDGNLHLVDRLKDMIVTGGENVYSAEVERALHEHPAVAAAAVVGAPDERWGERVVAFVVPADGAVPEAGQLTLHCRERIAGYKVPREFHLVAELPMTASGKVRKDQLRMSAQR